MTRRPLVLEAMPGSRRPAAMAWLAALFGRLRDDQAGAVVVDWVAATAGVLLLGIVVSYSVFNGGVAPLVSKINVALIEANVERDGNAEAYEERTGNASDQACSNTGKWVVCMGPN